MVRSACRSWTPQSQRREPSESPVTHSECIRTRTSSPSPILPRHRHRWIDPAHSNACVSHPPNGVGSVRFATSVGTIVVADTGRCVPIWVSPQSPRRLDAADEGYRNGVEGRALRFVAPRRVEIQRVEVHPPAPEELLVRTRWSGISGGTELLAYRGELDPGLEVDETLPSLTGSFRFPFAYGYSCVGEVERSRVPGIEEGSTVFAFHPHQDRFTVRASEIVSLDAVDGRVATMIPLVETALQVSLDAGARIEEPVVVLGLGPVGVLAAALLQRSGADVVGVDPRADRRMT